MIALGQAHVSSSRCRGGAKGPPTCAVLVLPLSMGQWRQLSSARGDQPTCRCCRLVLHIVCVRHATSGLCRLGRAVTHYSPAPYCRCVGTSVPSLGVRVAACVRIDSSRVRARASVAVMQ